MKNETRRKKRTAAKDTRKAARTMKKGAKTVSRGKKQMDRQTKRASVSKTGATRKQRVKSADAATKIKSGTAAVRSGGKTKVKKKSTRNVPNINYGAPGQKKYLTPKGKQTNRY